MNTALNTPRPATVLAIGVTPRHSAFQTPMTVIREFTSLITGTLGNNCHIQRHNGNPAGFALTAIVPDNAQTLAPLRRMSNVQAEFHQTHPDMQVRYIVHHGVVFQSPEGHTGSALRSAHSRLERLPATIDKAATLDFVAFAETWPSQSIAFDDIPGLPNGGGLLAFHIGTPNGPTPIEPNAAIQPAQLRQLTSLLAEHLGPFADVLVATAQRACTTPQQLIVELSREIDEPNAREDFLAKARQLNAH